MKQTFWDKNKVFLMGLMAALAIAIQPFVSNTATEIQWPAVGTAAGLAVLGYLAKEWRGQGMSILGITGVASEVIYTLINEGHFTWGRALLSIVGAILFTAAPDPKSRGYEQSSTIKDAKKEGEAITPAKLTAKPK